MIGHYCIKECLSQGNLAVASKSFIQPAGEYSGVPCMVTSATRRRGCVDRDFHHWLLGGFHGPAASY